MEERPTSSSGVVIPGYLTLTLTLMSMNALSSTVLCVDITSSVLAMTSSLASSTRNCEMTVPCCRRLMERYVPRSLECHRKSTSRVSTHIYVGRSIESLFY